MSYPRWHYFPTNTTPPDWVEALIGVVAASESTISTEKQATGLNSDAVLRELADGLRSLGFDIEQGKSRMGKIPRPVLYGEGGTARVQYEVDGFHAQHQIVLEVEAGRGARGNAEYRDLLRTSLILDADFLVLLLPQIYRFNQGNKQGAERAFNNTQGLLEAVFASQRLRFPFHGILLVGY